jgi:hypothetical protein
MCFLLSQQQPADLLHILFKTAEIFIQYIIPNLSGQSACLKHVWDFILTEFQQDTHQDFIGELCYGNVNFL